MSKLHKHRESPLEYEASNASQRENWFTTAFLAVFGGGSLLLILVAAVIALLERRLQPVMLTIALTIVPLSWVLLMLKFKSNEFRNAQKIHGHKWSEKASPSRPAKPPSD